jgi:hypothetical protein
MVELLVGLYGVALDGLLADEALLNHFLQILDLKTFFKTILIFLGKARPWLQPGNTKLSLYC